MADNVESKESKDRELSALDPIDELRADDMVTISRQGAQSMNMTVENFQTAMNGDYSSLEEQILPGRKLMCPDGVARQAYIRTFVGTVPADGSEIVLSSGLKVVSLEWGGLVSSFGEFQPSGMISQGTMDYYWTHGCNGSIVIHDIGYRYWGQKYVLTFLYAKNE